MAQVSLFGGNQVQLFRTLELSRACTVALSTPLRCPSLVQSLSYPDYALGELQKATGGKIIIKFVTDTERKQGITTESLDALCGLNCQTDISDVAERLALRCAGDVLSLQIGNISFAEFGEFVKHRSDMLCLRESSEGRFCQLAMAESVFSF